MKYSHELAGYALWALCLGTAAGCSNDGSPIMPSQAAAPQPASWSERRVEDPGGGGEIVCGSQGVKDCLDALTLSAADGTAISAEDHAGECSLSGTGRFEGVFGNSCGFRIIGDRLSVSIQAILPVMGGQRFQITGLLAADVMLVPDAGCETGFWQEATVSGQLPHLGLVTGSYTGCVPGTE